MATTKKRQSVTRPLKKPLLIHHRHSFKLMHHRHTSYPTLLFMLLVTGLFSVAWTAFASGDAYNVTAVIPASPLLAAATITAPADGDQFTNQIITVSGNCPANSYVKLARNQVFAGSGLCQSGAWEVQLSLQPGPNLLHAQVYNVTDQPGPASQDITVSYMPPVEVANSNSDTPADQTGDVKTSTEPTPSKSAAPLILGSMFTYKGYLSDQLSNWPLTISGGTAPYAIQIDWGDGQTDLKSLAQAGDFDMQHMYSQASELQNTYTIKVTAEDAEGQTTILQLFTIISLVGSAGEANLNGSNGVTLPPAGSSGQIDAATPFQKFWKIAGPTYAVTTIAAASFWLGESHVAAHLLRPRFWHWHGLRWRH